MSEEMVSVPLEALRALIEYAEDQRVSVDQEFCGSLADHEDSERRFLAVVAALGLPEIWSA
jgi:hypothetical protein